jgi:hypothetical protein
MFPRHPIFLFLYSVSLFIFSTLPLDDLIAAYISFVSHFPLEKGA